MGIVNGWNGNQHGERQLSMMIIIKRELSMVCGMLVWQCRVHKNGVSNPSMAHPRPFPYLSKNIYKTCEQPYVPHGEMGGGGSFPVVNVVKFI